MRHNEVKPYWNTKSKSIIANSTKTLLMGNRLALIIKNSSSSYQLLSIDQANVQIFLSIFKN